MLKKKINRDGKEEIAISNNIEVRDFYWKSNEKSIHVLV